MGSRDRLILGAAIIGAMLLNGVFSVLIAASVQNQFAAAQQDARAQGSREVAALCTTFGRLGALRPPPGNPNTNPSRAYLQQEHATLDEIGTDLGCKRGG